MSRRNKLQKEYYKEYGSYKGEGKYSDHYVKWLEDRVLEKEAPLKVETMSFKVFSLANELALNGYGNSAVALHRIRNGMVKEGDFYSQQKDRN